MPSEHVKPRKYNMIDARVHNPTSAAVQRVVTRDQSLNPRQPPNHRSLATLVTPPKVKPHKMIADLGQQMNDSAAIVEVYQPDSLPNAAYDEPI